MSRRAAVLSLVFLAAVSACGPQRDAAAGAPGSDPKRMAASGVSTHALIADAAHGGDSPGFFFLPPLVPATAYGAFRPGLSPVVTVEELPPGTRGIIATFTTTSGVKEDDVAGQYQANWDTKSYSLDPSLTYRIHVKVQDLELGFADVDVVSSGAQLRNVQTSDYIALLEGRTLPIKFRIQSEALKCLGVVCTALDACHAPGVCDRWTGACSNPEKPNGSPCDDGNACTRLDTARPARAPARIL